MRLTLLSAAVLLLSFTARPTIVDALQTSDDSLVTWQGAGALTIGASLETFAEADIAETSLPDGSPGYAVSEQGRTFALVATDGSRAGPIQAIVFTDSSFRTAAGIGPGSTVAATEAAYGTAILSFDAESGREIVSVSSAPASIEFVIAEGGGPIAGIYSAGSAATIEYSTAATLASLWIDCRERACLPPRPAPASAEADAPTTLAATGLEEGAAMIGLGALGAGLAIIGTRNMIGPRARRPRARR